MLSFLYDSYVISAIQSNDNYIIFSVFYNTLFFTYISIKILFFLFPHFFHPAIEKGYNFFFFKKKVLVWASLRSTLEHQHVARTWPAKSRTAATRPACEVLLRRPTATPATANPPILDSPHHHHPLVPVAVSRPPHSFPAITARDASWRISRGIHDGDVESVTLIPSNQRRRSLVGLCCCLPFFIITSACEIRSMDPETAAFVARDIDAATNGGEVAEERRRKVELVQEAIRELLEEKRMRGERQRRRRQGGDGGGEEVRRDHEEEEDDLLSSLLSKVCTHFPFCTYSDWCTENSSIECISYSMYAIQWCLWLWLH